MKVDLQVKVSGVRSRTGDVTPVECLPTEYEAPSSIPSTVSSSSLSSSSSSRPPPSPPPPST